ncbi:MAG: DNA adenine methylase [Acidimicrobiales bacterium]
MIKYLGSKRRLVPVLGAMWTASGARTGLDLFTGTTRVAQEFKRRGGFVTAVDTARYAHVFAQTYVETDAGDIDSQRLAAAISDINSLVGDPGYVTQTFSEEARFFHPKNGARIDAARRHIADAYAATPLEPLLLTSLIEAADRVDSTTGVQMAYLKAWASRAHNDLTLRMPELLDGSGRAVRGDAVALAGGLGSFDLAYLDPPYNQHRYTANYHVWETLVANDEPEAYGVARKRIELQSSDATSVFNRKRLMPEALGSVIAAVDAGLVIVSYNNESWLSLDDLIDMGRPRGDVAVLGFDSKRYVGAQIGIHNNRGSKVGRVGRLRNTEYLMVCGDPETVEAVVSAAAESASMQVAART